MCEILLFTTTNCKPCGELIKWLDSEEVAYTTVNAHDHPEWANHYRIRTSPTLIVLDHGIPILRIAGTDMTEFKMWREGNNNEK